MLKMKRVETKNLDWNFFRVWLLVSTGPLLVYSAVGMLLGVGTFAADVILPILLLGAIIAVLFGQWLLLNQRLLNPLRWWFPATIVGVCMAIILLNLMPFLPLMMRYLIMAALMGTAFWYALRGVLPDMAWMLPAWVVGFLPMALAPLISFYGAFLVSVLLSMALIGLVLINGIAQVPELEIPVGDMVS